MKELKKEMTHQECQEWIQDFVKSKGWEGNSEAQNFYYLIQEIGEIAVELSDKQDKPNKENFKEELGEELVDVYNYLLQIASDNDIDFGEAFYKKNLKNKDRTWE